HLGRPAISARSVWNAATLTVARTGDPLRPRRLSIAGHGGSRDSYLRAAVSARFWISATIAAQWQATGGGRGLSQSRSGGHARSPGARQFRGRVLPRRHRRAYRARIPKER